MSDLLSAAREMESILVKGDDYSEWLIDQLKPKVGASQSAYTGRPILDLTGGRPETLEWLAFRAVVEQDNPYRYEYVDKLHGYIKEHASYTKHIKWIALIVQCVQNTACNSDAVLDSCKRILTDDIFRKRQSIELREAKRLCWSCGKPLSFTDKFMFFNKQHEKCRGEGYREDPK